MGIQERTNRYMEAAIYTPVAGSESGKSNSDKSERGRSTTLNLGRGTGAVRETGAVSTRAKSQPRASIAFFSIFRDLQDLQSFAPLQTK